MAIKRYDVAMVMEPMRAPSLEEENHPDGPYVKIEDHIDSHRFDEAAEYIRARVAYEDRKEKNKGYMPCSFSDFYHGWKACALAREKEFVG